MKNLKLMILLVMVVGGLFLNTTVLAQEEEIYTPRLLPDSPFFFLKEIKERIELFLAQSPEAQAEKQTELATRRIAEAKQMVEKNKYEWAEKLIKKYQEHLNKAMEKMEEAKENERDIEKTIEIVTQATSQHQLVLIEVYEKVPDQAKDAIENAIKVSSKGQEKALEAISGVKKKKECVCITLWEPVCGTDGKTYSNDCWLECAGVEKDYDGECNEGCGCKKKLEPTP